MEPSEVFVTVLSLGVSAFVWLRWVRGLLLVEPPIAKPGFRWLVPLSFIAFTAVNAKVLTKFAASDVRGDSKYILFYIALGWGVSALPLLGLRAFGIRPADISQGGNRAASIFAALTVTACAFAYAGANIGEGPGFHVVLFCSGLAYGALLAIVVVHEAVGHTAYRILVERDEGAGLRVGGLLVGCGIGLGRAAAGDWHGSNAAVSDFVRLGWPAGALGATDAVLARLMRGREPERRLGIDAVLGVAYVALAVYYVYRVGMPA